MPAAASARASSESPTPPLASASGRVPTPFSFDAFESMEPPMTAYLYDAVRTPRGRGKSNGSLHAVRPVDLLAQTLGALRDRNNLVGQTHQIDDVVIGCVTQIGDQGQC